MDGAMDLTSATPPEIDAELANLDRQEWAAEAKIASVITDLHYKLGEKAVYVTRTRKAWPTTDRQAIEAVRAKAEAGEMMSSMHGYRPFAEAYAKYEVAVDALTAIYAEAKPFNDEFVRRGGWSRFFLAQSSNGHYHSDMNCSTCNKNGQRTRFAWNPKMSGLSEADAITELAAHAAVLCSVCFPNAPVEMFTKRADPDECIGGVYLPGTSRRSGMNTYGQCPACKGQGILITMSGAVRKHKKPKPKGNAGK